MTRKAHDTTQLLSSTSIYLWVDLIAEPWISFSHYHLVTRCGPLSLESLKKYFETGRLIVLLLWEFLSPWRVKVGKI